MELRVNRHSNPANRDRVPRIKQDDSAAEIRPIRLDRAFNPPPPRSRVLQRAVGKPSSASRFDPPPRWAATVAHSEAADRAGQKRVRKPM